MSLSTAVADPRQQFFPASVDVRHDAGLHCGRGDSLRRHRVTKTRRSEAWQHGRCLLPGSLLDVLPSPNLPRRWRLCLLFSAGGPPMDILGRHPGTAPRVGPASQSVAISLAACKQIRHALSISQYTRNTARAAKCVLGVLCQHWATSIVDLTSRGCSHPV